MKALHLSQLWATLVCWGGLGNALGPAFLAISVFVFLGLLAGCHQQSLPATPTTRLTGAPLGAGIVPLVAYRVLVPGDTPGAITNIGCRLTDAQVRSRMSTLTRSFSLFSGTGAFDPQIDSSTGEIYIHDIWIPQTATAVPFTQTRNLFSSITGASQTTFGPLDRFMEVNATFAYFRNDPASTRIDLGFPHIAIYFTGPLWIFTSMGNERPWRNGLLGCTYDPPIARTWSRDSTIAYPAIFAEDSSFDFSLARSIINNSINPNNPEPDLLTSISALMTAPNSAYWPGVLEHEVAHYLSRLEGREMPETGVAGAVHYYGPDEHAYVGSLAGGSTVQYPNLLKRNAPSPYLWEGASWTLGFPAISGNNDRGHTSSRILHFDINGERLWSVP